MKRRTIGAGVLLLASLLLVGCSSGPPINMDVSIPYHDDEALNVKYNYRLILGNYDGQNYNLMGLHDSKLAFVIRDIARLPYSNRVIVDLWMRNVSNEPITFDIGGFFILSPDGKKYSVDDKYQLDMAVKRSGTEYGYVTLQPDEVLRTDLYFYITNIDIYNLSGWRFGFNADSYLSFLGILTSLLTQQRYVWLYPAYQID